MGPLIAKIRKVPHLLKVRKSNTLKKSTNLWILDLRIICGPPTFALNSHFTDHYTAILEFRYGELHYFFLKLPLPKALSKVSKVSKVIVQDRTIAGF
jgi:hypothetical protein